MAIKHPLRLLLALFLGLALLAAACGSDDDSSSSSSSSAPADEEATEEATEAPTEAPADEAMGGVLDFRPLDAGGPLTTEALSSGDIDVALLFTSDPSIAANGWVLLEDDKALQQIENLVPAIRTDVVTDDIAAALDAISAPLTTAELTELNRQVIIDLADADAVARQWLEDQGLLPYAGPALSGDITVGSTNFYEQEILAELYAITLEEAGMNVDRQFQLGSREVVAPAIEAGEIDLYPEYLGTYTVFNDAEATVPSDPEEAAAQLRELVEPNGVTVLTPAPAEDRNGLVVTVETAELYGLAITSDLATVTEVLVFGGPPECPEREFCAIGLEDVYGLTINL